MLLSDMLANGTESPRRTSCGPNSELVRWTNINGACSWEWWPLGQPTGPFGWVRRCNGWPDDPFISTRLDFMGDASYPSSLYTPAAGAQCGKNPDCQVYVIPDGAPPAYNFLNYTSARVYTGAKDCIGFDESHNFDPTCEPIFTTTESWNVRVCDIKPRPCMH